MNVLLFGFDIEDEVAPRVFSMYTYPVGNQSHVNGIPHKQRFPVVIDSGRYGLKDLPVLMVNGRIGFGIEAFDFLNGSRNRCGIYSIKMLIDGVLKYKWKMDQFMFSESRYINSYIDYEEKQLNSRLVQKTFLEPNNRLGLYEYIEDEGIFDFSNDKDYHLMFILEDALPTAPNYPCIRGGQSHSNSPPSPIEYFVQEFPWDQPNEFSKGGVILKIPKGCLYDDLDFTYQISEAVAGSYSPGSPHPSYPDTDAPAGWLAIRPDSLPVELRDKAYLGYMNGEEGKTEAAGGGWNRRHGQGKYTLIWQVYGAGRHHSSRA